MQAWAGALGWLLSAGVAATNVTVVPNRTVKVCQLTGEIDRERGQPTLNRTETRFGLKGTDLGSSFEHQGHTYFLFGDSGPVAGLTRDSSADSMAFTDSAAPRSRASRSPS